jgi:glycerophosphoryl diester phosphodiesterase
LFSSFLPHNLTRAAKLLPEIPRGLLASPRLVGWWARSFGFAFGDYQALHPFLNDVTVQQIARVHRLQRRVHVWTVNAESDLRRLFHWGVDGVFTDDPVLALHLLEERHDSNRVG